MSDSATPLNDTVRHYLNSIGRIPLLKRDQEVEFGNQVQRMRRVLAKPEYKEIDEAILMECRDDRITEDDRQIIRIGRRAHSRMVEANLRLVVSIAKKRKYQDRGLDMLDLIQEGSIGLQKAAENFDPTKGFRFSTYAYWWIRQAINRGLSCHSRTIRLPSHIVERITKLPKVRHKLRNKLGRSPTDAEIAQEMSMTLPQLRSMVQLMHPTASLDCLVTSDSEASLIEFIGRCDDHSQAEIESELYPLLSCLSPRERKVINLRYGLISGDPLPLKDIAAQFNVSRERVRQVEVRAMRKLRRQAEFAAQASSRPSRSTSSLPAKSATIDQLARSSASLSASSF